METVNRGSYVVMGVAGSGKSTVGTALAHALGVDFVEGDDYHSADNVKRMASGIPLTDADRAGWLRALAARFRDHGSDAVCRLRLRDYGDVIGLYVRMKGALPAKSDTG